MKLILLLSVLMSLGFSVIAESTPEISVIEEYVEILNHSETERISYDEELVSFGSIFQTIIAVERLDNDELGRTCLFGAELPQIVPGGRTTIELQSSFLCGPIGSFEPNSTVFYRPECPFGQNCSLPGMGAGNLTTKRKKNAASLPDSVWEYPTIMFFEISVH